jgi:hypothetical protein
MPPKRTRSQPKTAAAVAAPAQAAKPQSGLSRRFAALGQSPWGYVLASIAALLPCYWGTHIQAGDLSSHIYNSWLGQFVQTQKAVGLMVASQATNVLFDLILGGLFRTLGPDLAQRIAASVSVLTFIGGAFAFASAASGKRAWPVLPCIAMLAYGWVFHMGFFDFYLGLGLSFWALAAAWNPTPKRVAAAGLLLALAFFAHALAFAWGAAFVAYLIAEKYFGAARRLHLTLGGLAALIVARIAAGTAWPVRWTADQIALVTGADQVRVFDDKYFLIFFALLAVWVLAIIDIICNRRVGPVYSSLPFQLCLLSAAGVFFLPGGIQLPGYRHGLVFIAERLSLGVGVCMCALLASAAFGPLQRWSMAAVAAAFCLFLFHDERALNAFEQRVGQAVAVLPRGQRVLLGIDDDSLTRVNALTHMIDRECIGRCFSYANYEPSTWQFRVRAVAPNPYVASEYKDSIMMQIGNYVVKPSDLPLYEVTVDNAGNVIAMTLQAGQQNGVRLFKVLPALL